MINKNKQSGIILLSASIVITLLLLTVILTYKLSITNAKFVALSVNYLTAGEAAEYGLQNAITFINAHSKPPNLRKTTTANKNKEQYYQSNSVKPNSNIIWASNELAKYLPTHFIEANNVRDKNFDNAAIKIKLTDDILTYTIIEDLTNGSAVIASDELSSVNYEHRNFYQITVKAVKIVNENDCLKNSNNDSSRYFSANNCVEKESVMLQRLYSKNWKNILINIY